MRLRNLVLAACAAFGLAMPAQAQLTLEWHLVSVNPPSNSSATAAFAQTNAAITANQFTGAGALVEGSTVMLQLMLRDNAANGRTFAWQFGDGILSPPPSNINGVGVLAWGATIRSNNAAVFRPTGDNPPPGITLSNVRGTPTNPAELAGPGNGTGYPLPFDDFSGVSPTPQPYATSFSNFTGGDATVQSISNVLATVTPFENGDFPRQRPGTTSYLMPLFNMRFTAVANGSTTLSLVDPLAGTADWLVTGAGGAVEPGGDMLDAGLFGTYVPLNIQVVPVPEPTSMALVGMAIAGIGYRKLRRKKTTEVVA